MKSSEQKKLQDQKWQRSDAGKAYLVAYRKKRKARKNHSYESFTYMLRCRYGIDAEDWARLANSQEMKCKICQSSISPGFGSCVDHDHNTGSIRGILCRRCNRAIGMFRDDDKLLAIAAIYIQTTGTMK